MTTIQIILIVIAVFVMLAGLYMVVRGLGKKSSQQALTDGQHDKNGIPIIPRHKRQFEDPYDQQADMQAADVQADSPLDMHESDSTEQVISAHLEDAIVYDTQDSPSHAPQSDSSAENEQWQQWQDAQAKADDQEFAELAEAYTQPAEHSVSYSSVSYNAKSYSTENHNTQNHHTENDTAGSYQQTHYHGADVVDEPDAFSSLASATKNLVPVVDTVAEPKFTDNSPLLDQHLMTQADQDKHSPLNNAQENINITLLPKNSFDTISGEAVLDLVDKYGLKFGPMNMFHRYEEKDGTGILWFSMMGITQDGIIPFDLNTLPETRFHGLVLFLSLPHPKALQGFDSMMSIASLIARELGASILDEHNNQLTRDEKQKLRTYVQDYRPS